MYLVLSKIDVQQVTKFKDSNGNEHTRDKKFSLKFVNSYEVNSTWADLTQTCTLTLPKNITIKDDSSNTLMIANRTGKNSNLGGFSVANLPLFMRGDMITFNVGYRVKLEDNSEVEYWTGQDGRLDLFKGFISKVNPKLPFTLECEDNMWLCKQIPTEAKHYSDNNLQNIVNDIINKAIDLPLIQQYNKYGVNIKVSDFSKTDLIFNVNNLSTYRGSLATFLERIKREYKLDSYFRGIELRIGLTHYIPEDSVMHAFTFQKNIISDKLDWQRRDDTLLSCVVKSHYRVSNEAEETVFGGAVKTKAASTEVFIYNNGSKFEKVVKPEKGGANYLQDYLGNVGEKYCINIYSPTNDTNKLYNIGQTYLKRYYYDGFKGSFETFGIPQVKHGDTVEFVDYILPERNGKYKVKAVRSYGGWETGLRQEITLDYKID
jgi:hypothetical protein